MSDTGERRTTGDAAAQRMEVSIAMWAGGVVSVWAAALVWVWGGSVLWFAGIQTVIWFLFPARSAWVLWREVNTE